jgi:NAD(P)-dependent dehydrogenase (short-subunit alcohol dehydrogenase family)
MGYADLQGRVALVTGAAGGIGYAIAEALGSCGAAVVVNDFREEPAAQAASRLAGRGIRATAVSGNVTDSAQVRKMVATAVSELGRLDIVVNNAGVLRPTRFELIDEAEWELIITGNLTSTYLCCRAAIPELRRNGGGSIVNISSSAGKSVSTIGGAHYTAAKAGVLGLTRHLARELAADHIRVNAVCPGLIDTEMVRSTIEPARVAAYASTFPARRLGTPREVADLVVYLASSRSSYITGASVDVNGGDLTI